MIGHPRDRFITVYGRKPVLEALETPGVRVDKVFIARNARGPVIDAIRQRAESAGVTYRRVAPAEVTRLSRNQRQDQGAVADVVAPRMSALDAWLDRPEHRSTDEPRRLLMLDGLTNPANIGMILRSATAAGLDGVILPRAGSPEVGPLVVKASAGVAFRAPILRTPDAETAAVALGGAGFVRLGLAGGATESIFDAALPSRVAFVVGNETDGISPAVAAHLDGSVSIPLAPGVESLNAAIAASIVAFEIRRRRG